MLAEIFRFELRYQFRQPVFWVSSFFFFLLTFFAVSTDAIVLGGSIGKIHRNAPFVIMQLMLVMSLLGIFVVTAFVAGTVLRDYDHRTQAMFFSTPMKKRDYLLGRFFGSLTAALALFGIVALAIWLGSLMPWLEAERVGPFDWKPYAFALGVLVAPNLLLSGSLFFALATWTRNLMYTYVGVVALFVGYMVAGVLSQDVQQDEMSVILDPFGSGAFTYLTKYWTVAERNSQILPLSEPLVLNRLLWIGVGLLIFGLAYWRFRFTVRERKAKKDKKNRSRESVQELSVSRPLDTYDVHAPQRFDWRTAVAQLGRQTRFEVGTIAKSLAFPIILAFGVLNIVGNSFAVDQLFGTPVYPVTHLMINILQGAFLFVLIVITFYSGEVVWRERSHRMHEVQDALPVPHWAQWGGKMAALAFVLFTLLAVSILTSVAIQAARGYQDFEWSLYVQGIFGVVGIPFLLAMVLALFLQVVSGNKYLGFLLMILYFISGPVLSALDLQHNLYQYAGSPPTPYSDMNGYGHFLAGASWYYVYWSLFAIVLLVLVHLFWIRGSEEGFRRRLTIARRRLKGPAAGVLAAAGVAFVAVGSFIYYNTNVLNDYLPNDVQEERQARFEKLYRQYIDLPQPKITGVYAEVDIYPDERDVMIRGHYRVQNKTSEAISQLHLTVAPDVTIRELSFPGARSTLEDDELGYFIYDLEDPMEPGETRELTYDLAVLRDGFVNHSPDTRIVENGTFFNSQHFFPHIGYAGGGELVDPNTRREYGLPPVQRLPDLDDADARQANALSSESDWLDFETIVSTRADQIALAPGYLVRQWEENGRRYFHYEMDAPILGFWAYLSADWEVARDRWNDVDIEIYYDAKHPYNVERMIDGVKASLDYFTENFGPYQHRQVRILEFPRYARFAQSFPNTIPFSESIGFIARLDDPQDIDYVFYVTAHEVAHQWWGHQVVGGNVQGSTMLIETLSQYSALMVMKREYGEEHMRKFLKYELDSYLRGRGGELVEELPLFRVENQPYIHYRKGSLVMYALQDAVGEGRLNQALTDFVADMKFQEPPYTYTRDFLDYVEAITPPEQRPFVDDLFRHITLYDNRAQEALWERRDDGKYVVRLKVSSQKLRADGGGTEETVELGDWMDVGVFGAPGEDTPKEGKVLAVERRKVTEPETVFELVVDEEPRQAGIDPFNKLIDRNPEDNLTRVSEAQSEQGLSQIGSL